VDSIVLLAPITSTQVVEGMRHPFMRSFGVSFVGRRLARSAWPAFQAALLHGVGIDTAASHARAAAEAANLRTMLVARWTTLRIARVVQHAADAAADAS
jgi:hypothetical protein